MLLRRITLALGLLGALLIAPASANPVDTVNVYIVGSNPPGNALDPVGTPIGGVASISWNHNLAYMGPDQILLAIIAEGVDGGPGAPSGGELDTVIFNGVAVGFLTQQPFYSTLFNLQPGPGALAGITALTVSIFDVTSHFVSGLNTVTVNVDPGNWVNEIEVSTLVATPIPAALPLFASGIGVMGLLGWRRKRKKGCSDGRRVTARLQEMILP